MTITKSKMSKGYTAKDLKEVSFNPEWTREDFARAKLFANVFPELAASIRRGRGPDKELTGKPVSLRLSRDVLEQHRSERPGWQTKIDETLRKAAKLRA
jgi:uncharacterized protein (DUF4415 family)